MHQLITHGDVPACLVRSPKPEGSHSWVTLLCLSASPLAHDLIYSPELAADIWNQNNKSALRWTPAGPLKAPHIVTPPAESRAVPPARLRRRSDAGKS